MKHYCVLFLLLLGVSVQDLSAEPPLWQKVDIGASGCKAYFPGIPPEATVMLTSDSSKMYTMSLPSDHWEGYYFNLITVVLKDGQFTGNEENMLISYMDFLKQQFGVTEAMGYGKGHTLDTHPTSKGIIDYWENSDGYYFTLTGWCAEDILTIMYVVGEQNHLDYNICNMFFKGFRFPGD